METTPTIPDPDTEFVLSISAQMAQPKRPELSLSDLMRRQMAIKKMNQVALAKACQVSQGTVSNWLNGAVPALNKIRRISAALDIDPGTLVSCALSAPKK